MANFLKYSGLTFDEIMRQINDKLRSDERFDNFRESAIAQMLVEIFAGSVDLVNYYIERRAEESFFDTARLRSSVILLARSLGYVVQRPIPAEAQIKLKLTGDWRGLGLNSQSTIQIPIQSVFSYGGLNFVLKDTITLNFADYQDILIANDAETSFILTDNNSAKMNIVQGEVREKLIEGTTNPQIGSNFQLYRIEDKEFSNQYGEDDFDTPITKVWVGNTKSSETLYAINRRSLIDWNVIDAASDGETKNVCVLRTAITEGVELMFGDGRFAQMGAQTSAQGVRSSDDNIYIQYFATKGAEANRVGVKDKKIQFSDKAYDSNGNDVTDRIEFYFGSNITNGADMEDIDSIRINAPNIYYSLDRLVAKRDYINYLKSLTTPIDVKNAIAWGEQEELNERGIDAMIRMFNVVFFSVIGPLYQTDISPYYVRTKTNGLDNAVLDYGYDDDEINQRNYFNVFTKGYIQNSSNLVEQLKEYQTNQYVWKINGDQVATSASGIYYQSTYGQNMNMSVNYTTDTVANNPSLSGVSTVTLDVRSLSAHSNFDSAMNALATILQNGLLALNDERGTNIVQNANFGSQAFPGLTVTYNGTTQKFTITHGNDTPSYINLIEGMAGESNDPASDMGLSQAAPFLVTIDRELSKKIRDVVDDLDKRSQVTIRNIYISPTIQSMQLIGKIYLKDLYDKQTERTNIEDAIYSWFNDNVDFNQEIYISNVIELIEQFPSVLYADVRFVPSVPVNPNGGAYYQSGNHPSVENAFTSTTLKTGLYAIIDSQINSYILNAQNETDTSGANERNVSYTISSGIKVAQAYTFGWSRTITERTFFENFAKDLYNVLILDANYASWANSDSFMNLISDIRKDYLEIIRFNLIDTQGNIAPDIQTDSSGVPIKGGYSLGSEIVKINVNTTYEYKR